MSRQFELQKLIDKHQRRLQKLKEKKATWGINTSPEILVEIEDIEVEVENLLAELKNLELQQSAEPPDSISGGVHNKTIKNEVSKSPVEVLVANIGFRGSIIVLVIGLISVGVTAYFGYLGIQAQITVLLQATQTAEVTSAQLAVSMTPTGNVRTVSFNAECPEPKIYSSSTNFDNETVLIPGTTFTMGDQDIGPIENEVSLEAFWIDKFEVTNLQYKRFLAKTNRASPISWGGTNYPIGEAFHPVVGVTWDDAVAYCESIGKRLPTEAEWELVCRGKANSLYPWDDKFNPHLANIPESLCGKTLPVGSYSPEGDTDYGTSDIIGNVAEWTSSIHMDYPYDPVDGREDIINNGDNRIIRGGSFKLELSCVHRLSSPPSFSMEDVGFRCVKD